MLWAQCTTLQKSFCQKTCSTFTGRQLVECLGGCEARCGQKPPPPQQHFVSMSNSSQVTADDIAQFDAKWMKPEDQTNHVQGALCIVFNRYAPGAWGTGEIMRSLVRMYDLTHQARYVDNLHQLTEVVLKYRDDNYDPGTPPYASGSDGAICGATSAPFPKQPVDTFRGKTEPGWSGGTLYDNVGPGKMDEDASSLYAYPIAAFARIVAEDATLQAKYGQDAIRYTNAALQTVWALEPQIQTREKGTNFEAYLSQLEVYRTKPGTTDCQKFGDQEKAFMDATNNAVKAAGETPPYDQSSYDRLGRQESNCKNLQCVAGAPLAHNESGLYGMTLIELWRAIDSSFYQQSRQKATNADLSHNLFPILISRFYRYFADSLQIRADSTNGDRYYWHYQDDQPSCVGEGSEDIGHGQIDMLFVDLVRTNVNRLNASAKNEPIPFDTLQLRHFANTFLGKVVSGADLNSDIDGNPTNPRGMDNSACEGWVGLAVSDPNVYRQCRDITLAAGATQPALSIGNHSALLEAKLFAREVSHLDLSNLAGAPQAAGDPYGFVFPQQDVQNIVYRATDGHAHELWRTSTRNGHSDLSALAHAPSVSGDPKAYVFDLVGMQNAIYHGTDGHLHGLFWSTGAVGHDDLTALSHAAGPVGNIYPYISANGTLQNVAYRGADNHVHVLYWSTGAVGHDDLTALSGTPNATGDPFPYIGPQGIQNVVFRATDGHMHRLHWTTGAVANDDLTVLSHAPAPSGDPAAYVATNIGYQNVVYRGIDAHLHGLYWSNGAVGHDDLTLESAAPQPTGNPAAYFLATDATQHVVFRSSDGHLYELWWTTGAVSRTDLTALASAPLAAGDPSAYRVASEGCAQHVVYRGTDGHLHELRWGGSVRLSGLPSSCETSNSVIERR
jgi:hypothetical protein